jgi:SAM-dependent methyltransferase
MSTSPESRPHAATAGASQGVASPQWISGAHSDRALGWYKTFFGEDYLLTHEHLVPPERTAEEVPAIVRLLDLPPGSAVLDLCCGQGRHAIALAEMGYVVSGLDLSRTLLTHARAEAERRGVRVRWIQSDMRVIPFVEAFDAVICMWESFGYLETDADDLAALAAAARALKVGGRFLLEVGNRDYRLAHHAASSITRYPMGLIGVAERHFDLLAGRNYVRLTLVGPETQRREYWHATRLYTPSEISRILAASDLSVHHFLGGLDGSELTLESSRMIVVSAKADPPAHLTRHRFSPATYWREAATDPDERRLLAPRGRKGQYVVRSRTGAGTTLRRIGPHGEVHGT